ncbi:MAG: porin [Gemmatimonadales bacterium]
MKRVALLCMGLVMGAASAAEAQLTMQMSNGWSFTFGGNVNAFLVYEKPSDNAAPTITPGGIVAAGGEGATRIRTGLLPAFAVFDAKGKEGNTDLGVHFGFAPQIQCGTNGAGTAVLHDCFGAQIDMRQVYLTVGGAWGQILAGRELGLFGRQNILTDQTLFGIGGTGGQFSGGTTLGRIGFGYIYPQFKAQMTYSTAAGRPFQLSIGLFDPASNGPYTQIETPRVEAEGVWAAGNTKVWVGGLVQNNKTGGVGSVSATSWGGTGGVRFGNPTFSLTASGYYGKGLGTTLLYTLGNGVGGTLGDDLRKSMGGIGQVTFTPANSKMTIAGSWGISILKESPTEAAFKTKNWLASGGIYYQATKSLKAVGEFNYAVTGDDSALSDDNKSIAPAVGLMLFF